MEFRACFKCQHVMPFNIDSRRKRVYRKTVVVAEKRWSALTRFATHDSAYTQWHPVYYRPQRSWGKVMFLQVCVILFTGGEYLPRYPPGPGTPQTRYPPGTRYTPTDQAHPPDQVHPPGPGRYGLRAGGTHPTGMQSCCYGNFRQKQ